MAQGFSSVPVVYSTDVMTLISTEEIAVAVLYNREQMAAQCSINREQMIITVWYQQRVNDNYTMISTENR
jgi:hypothetical protein